MLSFIYFLRKTVKHSVVSPGSNTWILYPPNLLPWSAAAPSTVRFAPSAHAPRAAATSLCRSHCQPRWPPNLPGSSSSSYSWLSSRPPSSRMRSGGRSKRADQGAKAGLQHQHHTVRRVRHHQRTDQHRALLLVLQGQEGLGVQAPRPPMRALF